LAELHRDRARATTFGTIAEQYDRYRPAPPECLLDDLAALRPERVLDIGCGTGKVARGLIERGLTLLGVEPDLRMAEIARGHGVKVEVSTFEAWDDRGRRFDLITCGDAWHWIDPGRGWRKIGQVLRPGATMARFWVDHEIDEPLRSVLDEVYARVEPELVGLRPEDELSDDPRTHRRTYLEPRTYSADEWAALAGTFSNHQLLPPERLEALQQELRAAIGRCGGVVAANVRAQVRFSGSRLSG
jgi:SAM-dependent methyltransferase